MRGPYLGLTKMAITILAIVGQESSKMRRNCFDPQKLLTTVRIQSGELILFPASRYIRSLTATPDAAAGNPHLLRYPYKPAV
jgi:hypothetical protein